MALERLLPQNNTNIQNLSNFNIQSYTESINMLRDQILELQQSAEQAEATLQLKYKQLQRQAKQRQEEQLQPI